MDFKKTKSPPRWSLRFFRWFCHPDYSEDIEGDLLERFEKHPSKWLFTWEVLKLIRPSLIKPANSGKLNFYGMYQHNIKIAWRNALRQKQFTVLNLLGLTIGISTCLLIGLYIHDEVSYDTFHENGDRIYRVNQPSIWGDWTSTMSTTGPNVATALREDAPEFEEVTRLLNLGSMTVTTSANGNQGNAFKENRLYAAEENFFKMFTFPSIIGDSKTAMQDPLAILLTEKTMKRYFGTQVTPTDAIGRNVEIKQYDGSWKSFVVKGILEDVPSRSHIQFDALVSIKSESEMMKAHGWKWIWTAFSTYGLVNEDVNIASLEHDIQALPPKWAPPTTKNIFNQSFEEFTAGNPWKLDLQPITDIYISGNPTSNAFGPIGNPLFVQLFGAIGVLVLILSAINFMNLSTARASSRSKEVGMRKVMGSRRESIIQQFMLESMLFVSVGTLLAFLLVNLSIDPFNHFADKQIELSPYLSNPTFYAVTIAFILLLGLLAGSYPAFYLSSFKPIESLKGKLKTGFKGISLRNGLVVFQFTISIALIICTFFVQKQLNYTSSMDVGFAKNNILQLHNIEQFGFDTESVKTKLVSNPAFISVGKSFGVPPSIGSGGRYKDPQPESPVVQLSNLRTEGDYLELLGLKFAAGRNFDASRHNDKDAVILNEEAVRMLGWSHEDLNASIGKSVALASGDEQEFEVIGIVEDFNFNSVKQEISPLIIINMHNENVWDYGAGLSYYSMRLNPDAIQTSNDLQKLLVDLEEELGEMDATIPFEYSFLDKAFEDTFRQEQKMATILNLFTMMAMIIACLGLFGLAAFSAEQRTKELGIRKVLGASVAELAATFSKEFTRLVGFSILLACPIAWYLVREWLQDFAYSTPIEMWVFVVAIAVALSIAISTISFQAIRSANRNPVETLKDE